MFTVRRSILLLFNTFSFLDWGTDGFEMGKTHISRGFSVFRSPRSALHGRRQFAKEPKSMMDQGIETGCVKLDNSRQTMI